VLFVDYVKTFDHVDHTTVLLQMAALGVDPKFLKWMHSFLFQRQQILINDLKTDLPTFKFVDDVTITEIISQAGSSQMQAAADHISRMVVL
jgi:hypothetical protein